MQKFILINFNRLIVFTVIPLILSACDFFPEKRFTLLSAEKTGVDFVNKLEPTTDLNIFSYLYFYDGAGVAAGDLNGDGLPDLFFTANQGANKLYLNKGNFEFEDVTDISFDAKEDDWSTGVTFADVNDDGMLDIYVSNVGHYLNIRGRNKLFINQGNNEQGIPVFKESAEEYGLDLVGFSTQAVFFDYDLDGDLDMYMMNHSVHSNNTFDYSDIREESHPLAGDRLMRNDNGRFVDVTEEAGIYNSALGYGLGIGISDLNQDGYPDIYIGNDFHEDDYLYINNGDGTFTESLEQMIRHTSRSSMGNDLVDINNDGLMDIFSLDMLPEDYEMAKTSAAEDPYRIYESKLKYGYKHQFSRNTLQLNRGNGRFSDIGMLAGVHATDWSWAALGADFDNNGYVDLFVSNGIKGRSNDMDYITFISADDIQQRLEGTMTEAELQLTDHMPAVKIPNYMYKNEGALIFEDVSEEWGLNHKSYSSGAVYTDLDGDGDLDIVINNVDNEAFIYRNNTVEKFQNSNYLRVKFRGPEGNRLGIGTKIEIPLSDNNTIVRELYPVRGFQSSLDYTLHIGLNSLSSIPKLVITWYDGRKQILRDVKANQTVIADYNDAVKNVGNRSTRSPRELFVEITDQLGISYKHEENDFVEFNREALIPHMVSKEGPAIAVGDVNGDGLDDFFAGGAKRQEASLYIQKDNGAFVKKETPAFKNDYIHEDVDAVFADVDGDGDQDLIVVSGGNEYYGHSEYMLPRLYINDGNGNFVRDTERLPKLYSTGSVVAAADIDNDGDVDLFLGSRAVPWKYGSPPTSYLLINNDGFFEVDTTSFGKKFSGLGLVTDARWSDMNNDGLPDLVVASEWSNMKIVYNTAGRQHAEVYEIPGSSGLWNTIEVADFDNDGQVDIAAGNLGLNSKFKASEEAPLRMYVNDFDGNGTVEQIITYVHKGEELLFATKDELAEQITFINRKFGSYKEFAGASLHEVIDKDVLEASNTYSVEELRSVMFYNRNSHFTKKPLPITVQFAPVHDFLVHDFNKDRYPDLLSAGNFFEANIQRGRYDADYGNILINDGRGILKQLPNDEINWYLEGQIRRLEPIRVGGRNVVIVAENNKPLRFFQFAERVPDKELSQHTADSKTTN